MFQTFISTRSKCPPNAPHTPLDWGIPRRGIGVYRSNGLVRLLVGIPVQRGNGLVRLLVGIPVQRGNGLVRLLVGIPVQRGNGLVRLLVGITVHWSNDLVRLLVGIPVQRSNGLVRLLVGIPVQWSNVLVGQLLDYWGLVGSVLGFGAASQFAFPVRFSWEHGFKSPTHQLNKLTLDHRLYMIHIKLCYNVYLHFPFSLRLPCQILQSIQNQERRQKFNRQ